MKLKLESSKKEKKKQLENYQFPTKLKWINDTSTVRFKDLFSFHSVIKKQGFCSTPL